MTSDLYMFQGLAWWLLEVAENTIAHQRGQREFAVHPRSHRVLMPVRKRERERERAALRLPLHSIVSKIQKTCLAFVTQIIGSPSIDIELTSFGHCKIPEPQGNHIEQFSQFP